MIRFLQTEGPVKKIVLSGLLLLICGAMVIAFVPGIGSDDGCAGQTGRYCQSEWRGDNCPRRCGRRRARWRNSRRSNTARRPR